MTSQAKIRNKLFKETMTETLDVLDRTDRCMVIRPTGFGKTYMLAHITKYFKKTLYIYPLEIIKIDLEKNYAGIIKPNTEYMSYRKLLMLYKADSDNMKKLIKGFDLVIMDEAHIAGGPQTRDAIKCLMDSNKTCKFIGATATPDRSDGYDVTGQLFGNTVLSEYGLSDAINDKLIKKPHYVYSMYQTVGALNTIKNSVGNIKNIDKQNKILEKIKAVEVEMGDLLNAPTVIKDGIQKAHPNGLNYMKFIVFFSEKQSLDLRKSEVSRWFKEAYPDMQIRNIIVTSDSEYADNIHEVDTLKYKDNTIDLIYCIDMLNMGYHISDLTGIIMLRGTQSNIIYKQQIGRCLSVTSNQTPIIFDLVNNIFKKPYFGELSGGEDINKDELNSSGGRFSGIETKNLIIDDKIASYMQFINRITYEIGQLTIDDAVNLYVNRSMPMKVVAQHTKLRESYIRREFDKRGVVVED